MNPIYYFHASIAQKILDADNAGLNSLELSLDLNISSREWEIRNHYLVLDRDRQLPVLDLEPIVSAGNKVFCLGRENSQLLPIEVRADGYYKLVPTDSVPTLEINGIKMHRSKDIDPLEDARLKTSLVVRANDSVLDTCGGLGYSALFAIKAGASQVVSTEKSNAVLTIRSQNPWLTANAHSWLTPEALGKIHLEHVDITRHIKGLADGTFDSVIHDPPRFNSATGDLYGKAFYAQLFRVMKPVSRLFHYTGSPKRIKEKERFVNNTMKRLEQAGFKKVVFNDRLQGIHGVKTGDTGGTGFPDWP